MFSIKDLYRLVVVSIISFCAVFVTNLFLNFYLDIRLLDQTNWLPEIRAAYDAQVAISWLIASISGAVLSLTSILLLFFYIRQFIDQHKPELGVLKALGYKNWEIARKFWLFSLPIGLGTGTGYFSSFAMMPHFYQLRNQSGVLPEITIRQHWSLFLFLVVLPTLSFAALAVLYASYCLRLPALDLLKRVSPSRKPPKRKTVKQIRKDRPFLKDLSASLLWSRKLLIFFVIFGSMCFSAMIQLSFGMKELTDETIQIMMMSIGTVLSVAILYLSLGVLLQENQETLAIMKVFGYSRNECHKSLFAPYRILAFLGFVLGTGYQYGIMQLLLRLMEKSIAQKVDYDFDFGVCLMTLLVFVLVYESLIYLSNRRIDQLTIKQVMLGE
ncbi:FtsX-like permease family protein [Streptococcus cristatus]|uniref:FtsX-like permease family protein n=1 Tax=Streptococcus cristatus TaxID=45634 RepID=UPI0005EEE6F2|nr:FtsX-like permease family protein [Streptococcus cristatus]KJQ57992.1 FtsX-like permease family protein [Streptococcus cristatus]QIP48805.1 FtsX-like permease family protein [Streptococcus cristatus ATCC 51100]